MAVNERENVFCPVEEDVVAVASYCGNCELWDGRSCTIGHSRKAAVRAVRKRGSRLGRRLGRRKSSRKGGRGMRVPPVYEKWPAMSPDQGDATFPDDEVEYGVAEFLPEGEVTQQPEEEQEYKLPELIEEYWDVEPDSPDWDLGAGSVEPTIPVLPADPLPRGLGSEPLPPATGPAPDLDGPGGPPVAPPDSPVPGMP